MLVGLGQIFLTAALSAAVPSSASVRDVPPSLMQGAECMAAVVRAVPGVTDVQVNASSAGSGGAYPILEFRSVDAFGRRRFTEISLFEISGANDAYVFDKADARTVLTAQSVGDATLAPVTRKPGTGECAVLATSAFRIDGLTAFRDGSAISDYQLVIESPYHCAADDYDRSQYPPFPRPF